MQLKTRNLIKGFILLFIMLMAFTLVGCDEEKFKIEHPIEYQIGKDLEKAAEFEADILLHVPPGTIETVAEGVAQLADKPYVAPNESSKN